VLERLLQRERLRPAVHEREQIHAERRLERRLLVELVQHDLAGRVALEHDDDAHALAIALVA
jgi:hypothetical protein